RSRPARISRTRPASASVLRCLVIAWRVTCAPALRRVMDSGPPAQRRATRSNRVLSPRAANTRTELRRVSGSPRSDPVPCSAPAWVFNLRVLTDISLDVAHLYCPAFRVASVGRFAALDGDFVEARLRDLQQCTVRPLLELECHQRGRLPGVILVGIDGMRVPAPGEHSAVGIQPFDGYGPHEVLVAWMLYGSGDLFTGGELLPGELYPEPLAKFPCVRQGAPHALTRGFDENFFLDAISAVRVHMQPPGCILVRYGMKCNSMVALSPSVVPPEVHAFVKVRHQLGVAVEHQRGPALGEKSSPDVALGCLAPARVVHLRIHVGVEAIFLRSGEIPGRARLALGEVDFGDGLDRLETILPGDDQPLRRPVLVGKSPAIKPNDEQGQRVHGLVDAQALDIRPLENRCTLARHALRIVERGEFDVLGFRSGLEALQQGAQL